MFTIRVVSTPEEREAIFQLRYAIYVEEMQRKQQYADHARRRIEEPLDATATLFGAWDDRGELIGTVRNNDHDFGPYRALYEMDRAGHLLPRCVITTKLMITQPWRHRSRLAVEMAVACYRHAMPRGSLFSFIDCNPPLVPLFLSLGYRKYRSPIDHPEYGRVDAMINGLTDREHLNRVGSPFQPWVPAEGLTPEAASVLYGSILRPDAAPEADAISA